MSKVAVLAVVVAAIICAEAVPLPQQIQDPFFQNFFQQFSSFPNGNGVVTHSNNDGQVIQAFSSDDGGSGYHTGYAFTSYKEPGKPAVVHEYIDDNGVKSEKQYTISN